MLDAPDRAETLATSDGPPARSGHDPVLAAIRLAPLASPADRELYLALRAEEKSDPRTWSSAEELGASLSKLPVDEGERTLHVSRLHPNEPLRRIIPLL